MAGRTEKSDTHIKTRAGSVLILTVFLWPEGWYSFKHAVKLCGIGMSR